MRAQSVGKCLKPPIDWNDQSQPESISVETFVHATVAKLKSLCCSEGASRLSKVRLSAFIRLGFPLHFAPCVCVCGRGKSSEALHMLLFLTYEQDVNSKNQLHCSNISLPCWKTVASMKPPGLKAT